MSHNAFENYSVLMSVYYKEKPEHLRQAIDSMLSQTVRTDDFVLVCDGPLTAELDLVVSEVLSKNEDIFNVVRLEKNCGLGKALETGLLECKNELVARMDSDDISMPNRCEKELKVFAKKPDLSIVGCNIHEFSGNTENVVATRKVPETHAEIVEFSKRRNPFNHMTVMFKKSDVLSCGNYQPFDRLEDYYLWVRMLIAKKQGYNIQDCLLFARVDKNMYARRSGKEYVKSQRKLFRYMKDNNFISYGQYLRAVIERTIISMVPNKMRQIAFVKLAR